VVFLAVGPAQLTLAQASANKKTVNVELIVDESGSMAAATDTGVLRIDAAKQVMAQVISAIPDVEGVNVGLRVYGHKGDNTDAGRAESCLSSELLVPMDGVDTTQLTAQVNALQPVGWTPLGFALEEAAKDFKEPASADVVNAIVMVTDGLETCDADPIAIAAKLHDSKAGIITHVVGFGTTPEEQTTLSEIAKSGGGQLLGSNNAGQLMDALFSILEKLDVVDETGTGETRDSPLGVGRIGTVGDYEISVLSLTPNANDAVATANQFNEPPAEGNQFFMARVSVTYRGTTTGKPASELNFQSVGGLSSSYTIFNDLCGAGAYGDEIYTAGELFDGGSAEFNICWQINSKDEKSLVMYVESYLSFQSDPVWFSLGNPIKKVVKADATATPAKVFTTPTSKAEPQPTREAKASRTPAANSRSNPLSIGENGAVGDYDVKVLSVNTNANDAVASANQFNKPPAVGKQFFMARVAVTYTGQATGNFAFELNFQAVGDLSSSYTIFNDTCGNYGEEPYTVSELFPGGSAEFNVCWQIDSDDEDSLVMYVDPLLDLNSKSVWFSLGNTPTASESTKAPTTATQPTKESAAPSIGTAIDLSAVDISFSPKDLTIPANTDVSVTVTNNGVLQHNFVLDEAGVDSGLLNGGESATVIINLPAGTYQFYCSVPGHKEAGMVGTLIVE